MLLRKKVSEELERLMKLNVISPIKSSPWATPIVPIVKQDGTVR
jgi:hypothetical protein